MTDFDTFDAAESLLGDRRAAPRADQDRRQHHDAVYTLARAAEMHDSDTGDHVARIRLIVTQLALALATDAGTTHVEAEAEAEAEALGFDAMLHDVGKLMVPPDVLKKPGELTPDEREAMASHTVLGERLLTDRPSMARAARIARSHHENWDGSGYPDGLRGTDIPLAARIVAVADVLDALIATRCYKQGMPYADAITHVIGLAGTKLDPDVVAALQRCHAAGELEPIWDVTNRAS